MNERGEGNHVNIVVRESLNAISMRDIAQSFIAAVVIAVLLKVFFLGMYTIPTRSMSPVLLSGDYVLVSKVAFSFGLPDYIPFTNIPFEHGIRYDYGTISKGDIVVFHFPYPQVYPTAPPFFIKRVAGIPGDTISVDNADVYYGEEALMHKRQRNSLEDEMPYSLPLVVPFSGMKLTLHKSTLNIWKPLLEHEGVEVMVRNDSIYLNAVLTSQYRVKQNYYYVLGDNTSDSFDSRYWGVVPEHTIIGRPIMVYWSVESNEYSGKSRVRWNRVGTFIK